MEMVGLPNEIADQIITYIKEYALLKNDVALLENLIFVNKYFRKIFIDKLNNNTLNGIKKPYNSYTYYSSDIKEKIYQYEKNVYKEGYIESVLYKGIKVGYIKRCIGSTYREIFPSNHIEVIKTFPFWRCSCYVLSNKRHFSECYKKNLELKKRLMFIIM